jgi:hypothetical protein
MVVVLPSVFYVRAYEHKVVGGQFLHAVAYDAPCAVAVGYEVQLVFLMAVHRIVEIGLVAVHEIEAVAFAQGSYFCYGMAHAGYMMDATFKVIPYFP